MKDQQVAKAQTREKTTRTALIVVGSIVAVFAIVLIANTFIGGDNIFRLAVINSSRNRFC